MTDLLPMNLPMQFDIATEAGRKKLAEQIENDINDYCCQIYESDHRNHLGASEMGEQCLRKLWYKFRWANKPVFDGRMRRIFQVGHEAEPRFIKYLRGIGFEVRPFAQQLWYSSTLNEYKVLEWDADLSGGIGSFELCTELYHYKEAEKRGQPVKQWRIEGANGHYGGSLDGLCIPPARYNLSSLILLNEFKTNNTGKGYNDVATDGIKKAKPKHYAQKCQYGARYGIKYGIYLIENKNDSEITIQIVELDWDYGRALEKKAEEIIFSQEPPPRIAENPSFYNCKYCDEFRDICHNGMQPEKNCRSCRQAIPTQNGTWTCTRFQSIIPEDWLKLGCDQWTPI